MTTFSEAVDLVTVLHDQEVAGLQTEKASLNTQLTSVNLQVTQLKARIAELEKAAPVVSVPGMELVYASHLDGFPDSPYTPDLYTKTFGMTTLDGLTSRIMTNTTMLNRTKMTGGARELVIAANTLDGIVACPIFKRPSEHVIMSWQIMVDPNFHPGGIGATPYPGGKLMGIGACIPGVSPTVASGGNTFGDKGCSVRMMWGGGSTSRAMQLLGYPYRYSQDGKYGDNLWLGVNLTPGIYQTFKMEAKLNTPGKTDGILRIWVDGNLRYESTQFMWRNRADVLWRAVQDSMFRGGAEVSNWAAPRTNSIFTKNVYVMAA